MSEFIYDFSTAINTDKKIVIYIKFAEMDNINLIKNKSKIIDFIKQYDVDFTMTSDTSVLLFTDMKEKEQDIFMQKSDILLSKIELNYKIVSFSKNDVENYEELFYIINFLIKKSNTTTYIATDEDFVLYKKQKYILSELKDIADKKDLNDSRVIVFVSL